MNDKCAGGTGAVIDKINAKLRIPSEELCNMGYKGMKLHPVAGKCGVFAETDINGLQKSGVEPPELMASLFEAIVMQNLSVLTRGNTLITTIISEPNIFCLRMPGKSNGIANTIRKDFQISTIGIHAGDRSKHRIFRFTNITRSPHRYIQFTIGPKGNVFPTMMLFSWKFIVHNLRFTRIG